ncbi:MAG: GNAT family N-acetyltransferase [Anaerolineae bacterium]|nr:GNAT family N-acetyltransferase [Anaerolineae bacterium]
MDESARERKGKYVMRARGYEGIQDLYAMLDLLAEGRKADNGTYYVHRGDLQWWLFYTDVPQEAWQPNIHLWIDDGDRLIGWALLSQGEYAFDVYVSPLLRGDSREHEMLAWAVEQMSALGSLQNVWVAEDDEVRIRWMKENGFKPEQGHFVHFKRSLFGPLDGPALPEGFSLRTSRGQEDARLRSVISHAAFGSSKPFEEYWPRTLRFMQSAVYVPEHEIFVVSPNGEIAAFCIIWTDELSKIGHFEPVATHPNFQRMGLGKSLLFEGMRRLKSEGMNEADVCTNDDNAPAIRLYESVGFQKAKRLLTYRKKRTT